MLKEKIVQLAEEYYPEFVEVRHHLHAHPELSFQEENTATFVQQKLSEWNIPSERIAGTGVTALIHGKNPNSRILALRADMDALPIDEQNEIAYKSKNPGVMHACGHDVHTTCLLGAAKILSDLKEEWEGTIKLIFQPGEEKNPGGASLLIKEGILENPRPHAILGLHVNPQLDVGKFSFLAGMAMASADELYFTVKSKGGHAAAPQWAPDTILAASQLVLSLQQIVSRKNDPFNPTVISITSIQGGNTTNVIPSEVKLMGTFRAMDEEWRTKVHQLIKNTAEHTAQISGTEIDCHIDLGYPCVVNNELLTEEVRSKATELWGEENIETTEKRMGAEDFAFYSQVIPASFYRLGVRNEAKNITSSVHTPTFNIDESAIKNGMMMMAWLGATVNTQLNF